MRILLVHDYGTPTGGAENQMLRLRELLIARGHEARMFSSRALPVADAPVHADYTCFGTTSKMQVLSAAVNPSAYFALRHAIDDFRPDIVHVRMFLWQLSPAILPLLRGLPALYQAVTYKSVCPVGTRVLPDGSQCKHRAGAICRSAGCLTLQSWIPMMLQRALWERWHDAFDAIVALSNAMRLRLEENGLTGVDVIYNGVSERPQRPPLNGLPVVAYAGRLSREKGLFVLLKALTRLKQEGLKFRFVVAGEGPLRPEFDSEVKRCGLQDCTDDFGYLPRLELERELDRAWVQVIPSLWDEPFGNVAAEALMRGTAAVASAAGGLGEIVEDGISGFLTPKGEVEPLSKNIGALLTNRSLAESMGQAGHQRAIDRFSEAANVDSFLQLYSRLSRKYA